MNRTCAAMLLMELLITTAAQAQDPAGVAKNDAGDQDTKMARLSKLFAAKAESLEIIPQASDVFL